MYRTKVTGSYAAEVELDDMYDLGIEFDVLAKYTYEEHTMYENNGDPGNPGYEDIDIIDIEPCAYWLIDKDGEEICDGEVYDEYRDAIDAKIKEVSDSIDIDDIDWGDPEDSEGIE